MLTICYVFVNVFWVVGSTSDITVCQECFGFLDKKDYLFDILKKSGSFPIWGE